MATSATPGSLRRLIMSPITEISGCPLIVRSSCTAIRPGRSRPAPVAWSRPQPLLATPMTGTSSTPRSTSPTSAGNVSSLARSPVAPKITTALALSVCLPAAPVMADPLEPESFPPLPSPTPSGEVYLGQAAGYTEIDGSIAALTGEYLAYGGEGREPRHQPGRAGARHRAGHLPGNEHDLHQRQVLLAVRLTVRRDVPAPGRTRRCRLAARRPAGSADHDQARLPARPGLQPGRHGDSADQRARQV